MSRDMVGSCGHPADGQTKTMVALTRTCSMTWVIRIILAACCLNAASALHHDQKGQGPSDAESSVDISALGASIVLFAKGPQQPAILQQVCNQTDPASSNVSKHGTTRVPLDCILPSGTCKRIYHAAVIGVAGIFTKQQLGLLHHCIPGGIVSQEPDRKVTLPKMRFSTARRYNSTEAAQAPASPVVQPRVTALSGTGRRALRDAASSPTVSLENENFREAETWEYAVSMPAISVGGRRSMKQGAESPLVTTGLEQFRDAATWQSVITNLTSSAAAYEVHGYGETIGPVASYPSVDMTKLNNGEGSDGTSAVQKTQMLPDNGVLWNLDRIDQRSLPLDREYTYGSKSSDGTGRGVTVYVVDSGIRTTHQEFISASTGQKRATFGVDFIGNFSQSSPIQDCDGHGTHVASIAVGRNVGVAKEANVVAVRVLDCEGTGTISDLVAGLDWVASNGKPPAVATLSLGVPVGQWSQSLEQAARSLITKFNVTVIVASGNSEEDSCYIAPADVGETISVAASDLSTKFNSTDRIVKDGFYTFSNLGSCVDIFAPGVDVYAACGGTFRCTQVNDTSYTWGSGTSMAAPHVAGVVAMYLEQQPRALPSEVKSTLIAAATKGTLELSSARPGTPNRLLYSWIGGNDIVSASMGPPAPRNMSCC